MVERPSPCRILLTGGGTGGHIYPALSIAAALREKLPRMELLYVGTEDGLESRLVPRAGIPFVAVAARGLVGKRPGDVLRGVAALCRGTWQARAALRRFRPHVVVGTGGYVSGPVAAAAVLLRIPVALQEQNAVPGVTNRLLSRFAGFVAAAYEESRPCFPKAAPVVVTGNPVRPEVLRADRGESRRRLGIGAGERLVVVFMGSRGSATVNRAVTDMLPRLRGRPGVRVLFGTGEAHYDDVLRRAHALGVAPGGNVEIRPYIHDMVPVLAAADLVVSRAGAVTLAEVTARGLPAVLIPSPHVTHHHQERNARALAERGAARVLDEAGLTGEALAAAVLGLLEDADRLSRMAAASRRLGRPEALDRIAEGILRLAGCGGGG